MKNVNNALRTIKGSYRGERAKVKTFKHSDDMHKFLCKDDNGLHWREYSERDEEEGMPAKNGTYAWAGQRWHNVKNLDPSALNHI